MPNNDRAQRRLDAKRAAKQDRHKLEALRREQARRERRRFLVATSMVVVVGLIIVAAVIVPAYLKNQNSPSHKALSSYGLSAAAATCDPEIKVADEPGPKDANVKTANDADRYHLQDSSPWTYQHNPPASGPHDPQPMPTAVHYYAPDAQTQAHFVEHLVHNLEHGFVIAWYDDTIAKDKGKLQALQDMGTNLEQKSNDPYFIAAPWPTSRPAMPSGKHVALTSWHAQTLCGDISGAALQTMVAAHPAICAPEDPTGAAAADVKAQCGTVPTPVTSTTATATTGASVSPSAGASTSPSAGTSTSPSASTSTSPSASKSPSPSASKSATTSASKSPSPSAS